MAGEKGEGRAQLAAGRFAAGGLVGFGIDGGE